MRRFTSIITRDNMNYQEYDWYFKPPASIETAVDSTDPWASKKSSSSFGSCVGDACCSDGLAYDSDLNQCVTSTSESSLTSTSTSFPTKDTTTETTTETFMNNIFTKSTNNYKKPDVILGSDNIESNNSKSFINNSKIK